MGVTYERQAYIPEGFTSEPTTPLEALRAARAVLDAEGRWMQGQWFHNEHPEVDPEDAFCNDWKVCAEGAVAIVTTGVLRARVPADGFSKERTTLWGWDTDNIGKVEGLDASAKLDLYREANRILADAGRDVFGYRSSEAWRYNDSMLIDSAAAKEIGRTKVLRWFDRAIEIAEQKETTNA